MTGAEPDHTLFDRVPVRRTGPRDGRSRLLAIASRDRCDGPGATGGAGRPPPTASAQRSDRAAPAERRAPRSGQSSPRSVRPWSAVGEIRNG